jgi:hypothetical protein
MDVLFFHIFGNHLTGYDVELKQAVLASIVGALLTIASEIAIREGPLHRAEALWVVATKGGILLFLATVALLPYRVSFVGGVICSILAAGTAITVFVAWDRIQRFSRPGGGGGGPI